MMAGLPKTLNCLCCIHPLKKQIQGIRIQHVLFSGYLPRILILILTGTIHISSRNPQEKRRFNEIIHLYLFRIILYSMHGKTRGYNTIRVKSPDSDVFFILLYYAPKIKDVTLLFDTGTGNKKRLIDVSEMAAGMTEVHAEALLSLHAFTGCDSTSCFKGIGKLKPLKVLQKMGNFEASLARLGDSWDVPSDLIDELDALTCALYGRPGIKRVDELRYLKLHEFGSEEQLRMSRNIDMSKVPPCRKSLEQHIRRVNYQVAIWKNSHVANPDVPAASDGHGWTHVEGKLEPLWFDGDALPQALINICQESSDDNTDNNDDDSDDGDVGVDEYPIFEDSDDD